MIEVYDLVTRQLDRGLDADGGATPPTRRLLRRCISKAASECEQLCPLVIVPGNVCNIHYGPQVPPGCERLAIFATHKTAMGVGFNGWPTRIKDMPEVPPAQFWYEMAKATTKGDADCAILLLAHRLGLTDKDAIETDIANAIKRGFTPVIVVLVGHKGNSACGAITTVVLPQTIATQMAGAVQ
jgi:hypothetical protein